MADDLGARLLRAGLVTRDQLSDTLAGAPEHGGALIAALAHRGVPEDALAGFFLADGLGPLMDEGDLAQRDPAATRRLPGAMAADLLALPVRASPAGLVVAMAAPSDRHAVREIARTVGSEVLPTVACVGALRSAIAAAYPEVSARVTAPPATPAAPDSEPPVLELVRRRGTPSEGIWMGGGAAKDAKLGPGPRLATPDDDVAVPLVRTKPMTTPAGGLQAATGPLPTKTGARVITKSFARPDGARKGPAPATPAARVAAYGEREDAPGEATAIAAPRTTAPEQAAPSSPASTPGVSIAPGTSRAPGSVGAPGTSSSPGTSRAPGSVDAPGVSITPGTSSAPGTVGAPRVSSRPPGGSAPASIVPPEHERWDVSGAGAAPAARPSKLAPGRASAELPKARVAPPEIGTALAAMRSATDRDEVVRIACEAALTVSRAAVFLALRKGVLKGWDGAGGGISRDSVRNLWIPTTTASSFKGVVENGEPYVGAYGGSVADGLFRAAVASHGGTVAIHAITVSEKVVGVLAADDLSSHGSLPKHRIEILAHAVSEAFKRILTAKR